MRRRSRVRVPKGRGFFPVSQASVPDLYKSEKLRPVIELITNPIHSQKLEPLTFELLNSWSDKTGAT